MKDKKEKKEYILKSYKIRLSPTDEQQKKFFQFAGCARYIYNWCLAFQKERYENGEKFIPAKGMSKYLTALKNDGEHDWLKQPDSITLVQAYTDCCTAFENFFDGVKKGKEVGYPKFKSRNKTKPSFASNIQTIKVLDNVIKYPKIGEVKAIGTNYIPKDIKFCTARTTFNGLHWYLSISTKRELDKSELPEHENFNIGVDLGIKDLAILSDGTKYKNIGKINEVKRTKKRLKKLQRQVSKKYEMNKGGENNFKKQIIL